MPTDPIPLDPTLHWLDIQIEGTRRKRDRAAILGMPREFDHFDFQLDELMARRSRYVRRYNLDDGGDAA